MVSPNTPPEKQPPLSKPVIAQSALDETLLVHQLFEKRVEIDSSAIAVRFGSQVLNYNELNRASNRFAAYLNSCELGDGAIVGVCIDRSIELMPILLGILKAGAAYLPLDPAFPPERLHHIAEDAEAALLVTQTNYRNLLPANSATFDVHRDWSKLAGFSDANRVRPIEQDALAYVIYTSGSTGKPKGVKVCHANVTNLLLSMAKEPGLSSDDHLLAPTTISFDMHVPELFLPLSVGACICLVSRPVAADAFKLVEALEKFSATIMQATPVTWRMLISAGWQGHAGFKVLIGGEALPKDLVAPLLQRCGQLWNMYGPTETTVWSTCHRIESASELISVGKPIDNTQVYIVNESGALVRDSEQGELCISGRGVSLGYYKRPELTADRFISNPFSNKAGEEVLYRTGDLACYDKRGNILHLGRMDNQIKIHGYRIEPGEVEAVLGQHAQIKQAVVDIMEVSSGDCRLVAFCKTDEPLDTSALRAHISDNLPHYMVPQHFFAITEFPLTPSGKIDRRRLLGTHQNAFQSETPTADLPASDLEKALLVVWRRILNNNAIGMDDHFVDVGGESILAFDLVLEMRRATGVKFSFEKMLENPTVRDLAKSIAIDKLSNPYNVVPLQAQGEQPPLYCLCGVSLYQELANNLGRVRPVYGIYAPREIDSLHNAMAGETTRMPVETLATRYCEAILQQNSEGPIQLLGFSFGGVLAVETARQLKLQNQPVAAVILIDSYLPHAITNNPLKRVKTCFHRVKKLLGTSRQREKGRTEETAGKASATTGQQSVRHVKARALRDKNYEDSTGAYVASGHRYDGDVVLIKAIDNEILEYKDMAPDYGWSHILIKPPEIHQVRGRHLDLMRGDYGKKAAAIVQQYLW